jgi:hypothetical protein
MAATVDALIDDYTRRYTAHDADGVTGLCLWPFLAIREGSPIHLADRNAVRDHFDTIMDAYRDAGYADFSPVEIDTRQLGGAAAFTTVRWHALDTEGNVVRDTQTTYHLLKTAAGWRLLSYTNHF